MKPRKTLILEAFRNIGARKVAFLSIVMIMLIGVGGLSMIFNLAYSLKGYGNRFFNEHNFEDFKIVGALGVIDKDIEEIAKVDGVRDVEGIYSTTGVIFAGEDKLATDLLSLTEKVSVPTVVEGKLPAGTKECAITESLKKRLHLKVGDEVKVVSTGIYGLLKEEKFTVTGIVDHPNYIRIANVAVLLPKESIDTEAVNDRYTSAIIKADIDVENNFGRKYDKQYDAVFANLSAFAESIEDDRTNELKDEALEKYSENEKEANEGLAEAKDKLTDGQKQLDEALSDAEKQLSDGEKKIEDGKATLESELAKAKKKLEDGEKELNQKLADARKEIDEGRQKADTEFANAYELLCQGEAAYRSGVEQYEDGKKQYDEGLEKIREAEEKLDDAREKIDEGNQKIIDKLKENEKDMGTYSDVLAFLFKESYLSCEELEKQHPEMTDDDNWKDFKNYLQTGDDIADNFRNGTDDERLELLKSTVVQIKDYYDVIPLPEEVRATMEDTFKKAESEFPEIGKLKEAVDGIYKLADAEKQYNEAKETLEEKIKEADLPAKEELLKEAKEKLDAGRDKLDRGWADYEYQKKEAYRKLDEAEEEYLKGKADGEKQIADGWKEYYRLKAEKEAELADGEEKLKESREEYEKNKTEKQNEIDDGWDKYYEEEEKVRTGLDEAKDKIDNMDRANYLISSRSLNVSFAEYNMMVNTIITFGWMFIPITSLVVGMVCFSTVAIIIDDQKKQVGAVKALGFYNREIRIKYLIFAGTGTLIGILAAVPVGLFLCRFLISKIVSSYVFNNVKAHISVGPLIVIIVVSVVTTIVVSGMACKKLLDCTAIGLINGSEPVSRTMKGVKKGRSKGNLYTKLIWNNFRMDKVRVIVSVVVIMGSCIMIGFGFTLKDSFSSALDYQKEEINLYNFMVVFNDKNIDRMDDIKKVVEKNGGRFAMANYTEGLLRLEDNDTEALFLISTDDEDFCDFINIMDEKKHKISIPEEGILLSQKVYERNEKADKIIVFDRKLNTYTAPVAGPLLNYMGGIAIGNSKTYEEIFDKSYEENCLFVLCDKEVSAKLQDAVLDAEDSVVINRSNYLITKGDNVKTLFDWVTLICIMVAVLLTFAILINITNILVNRRMRDMLVMRINGYTLKQVIGYVAGESAVTTAFGIILGIIAGVIFAMIAVRLMEDTQIMYYREPFATAWIYAALFNVGFAVIIDIITFRKIGKEPLTNIQ